MLSEESKRKRQRANTINIQMTFISWLLEFFAGLMYITIRFIKNRVVLNLLGISDIILNFVLIPMTYVLNNDVNKAIIVAHGWVQGFRRLINLGSVVVPEENNEEENPANPDTAPVRIPTTSRNIVERKNRRRRRNNNRRQGNSEGFTSQRLYAVADAMESIPSRRHKFRSESNQNLPGQVIESNSSDRVDLEEEAVASETIPLDDIRQFTTQNRPTNSIRAPLQNNWI